MVGMGTLLSGARRHSRTGRRRLYDRLGTIARDNFLTKLQADEELYPGIVGYDGTVLPEPKFRLRKSLPCNYRFTEGGCSAALPDERFSLAPSVSLQASCQTTLSKRLRNECS